MKKMLAFVFVGMIVCGSLAGCGRGAAKKAETNAAAESVQSVGTKRQEATTFGLEPLAERTVLSIGFFAGSAHSMPWYAAEQMGFFDELNIDVEYLSFTNGPAMLEASADWDVCDVGGPGVLNGMKNYDINMLGICDNEYNTGLFIRPDSDLAKDPSNPEAWRGKEILLNKGTTLQYMFMQYMKSIGIDDTDVYDIKITDTAVGTCLTAFQSGTGDAMCVWNAFACEAEDSGFVRVTDVGQMQLNNICGICATGGALETKADLVSAAYQIYYLTWEWCNENEENMTKATELFIESCDDEGIAVTDATADRLLEEFQCPSLNDAVSAMATLEDDRNGSGGKVSAAANQLFETLDFFISLGNYSEEDRQAILDKGLVNPVIAEMAAIQ